jgi:smad nuclear-interacting protein 1
MESARSSRIEDDSRRRRSASSDSEQERRRRRRRREREVEERNCGGRDDGEERRSKSVRDGWPEGGRNKYDDRDRKRRRSRSPAHESSRRQADRDLKYRSKRDRSEDRGGKERSSREGSAQISRKGKGPLPSQAASFQLNKDPSSALVLAGDKEVPEKQKPNFAPSGLLAAASNSVAQADGTSIVLKYHEPAEARKPPAKDIWKLFVFKGVDIVETIDLSLRSCWLIGRELAVVDLPAEHPSISKQHAVIQFKYIEKRNEFGDKLGKVRPYLIDLDSANGTSLNKEEIPGSRYLELRDKDMIQFVHSTREYVLMLSPKD